MMNFLTYNTGMRLGEIQVLKLENIKKDHIVVKYSWDRKFGLKTTKSGKERIVPISKELYNILLNYPKDKQSDFMFCNPKSKKSYQALIFGRNLRMALEKIGLSDKERKNRNITFHSWRHCFNTGLIKKVFHYLLCKQL